MPARIERDQQTSIAVTAQTFQYDAVGNREVMTDIAVHIYAYDAANRLTRADGAVYTWDNRGNLLADGTFTYTYSAAGRMVQAQNLTVTLVYTYNADGLRVADSCPQGLFCNPGVRGGRCAPYCRGGADCEAYLAAIGSQAELTCTPFGLCLEPSWRDWVEAGERIRCFREGIDDLRLQRVRVDRRQDYLDAPCVYAGWNQACGEDGFCAQVGDAVDYGPRDPAHPGDALVGTWGMFFQVATVTHGLPIVGTQPAYSANWVLARLVQSGDKLRLDLKVCDVDLINFEPATELAFMTFPNTYMPSLAIGHQTIPLASSAAGTVFDSDPLLEVRGAILADEQTDPLPSFHDEGTPLWAVAWDQDADNQPGITVLMDGTLRAEIYNCQRWGEVLHGRIYDRDHLGGLMTAHSSQYMLGANPEEVLYHSEVQIHEDPQRTYFRMQRLPELATCDDVLLHQYEAGHWLSQSDRYGDVAAP